MTRPVSTSAAAAFLVLVLSMTPLASARTPDAGRNATARRCQRWVGPSGRDGAPGTKTKPWATLERASSAVPDRHCIVWVQNGTYDGVNSIDRTFRTHTFFRAVHPYQAILRSNGSALDIGSGAAHMTFAGFQFEQTSSGSGVLVYLSGGKHPPAPRGITFRNDIFHDSYGDDVMKIRGGSHAITVVDNIFYNQADNEQLIDVNSVYDVTIQRNIFFEDFAASGRSDSRSTKHFIVVKDSDGNDDHRLGSSNIRIRSNVFMHYEGGPESMIAIGNDGKPYIEAKHVRIYDNLMIGDGPDPLHTTLTVNGARDVGFFNNTVVGDQSSSSFGFEVDTKGQNPKNRNVWFSNNIWDDPTGTMGDFSSGTRSHTVGLTLDHNLYWNAGKRIKKGDLIGPGADRHHVLRNPRLNPHQSGLVLPLWNGSRFPSGLRSIHAEFLRLVRTYGRIPANSAAVRHALASIAPAVDILGHRRGPRPDIGAFEI
jgi:hypothetical protein